MSALLLALLLQNSAPLYEVGCFSTRGDTAFLDTLPAGSWRYGDLVIERAPTKPEPVGRVLVVQYPGGVLVNYACGERPWVRRLEQPPESQS